MNHYTPDGSKVHKRYFEHKSQSQGQKALNFVPFERASLVEYVCLILMKSGSKVKANVKVDNKQTDKQTTNSQTDTRTNILPRSFNSGPYRLVLILLCSWEYNLDAEQTNRFSLRSAQTFIPMNSKMRIPFLI